MKNKKILVTGATGLLGSWLSESLVQNNCNVTGLALNTELDFLISLENFTLNSLTNSGLAQLQ